MYPKRSKEVISEYTELTDIPLDDSELMIGHYYRTIRQKASSMEEHWNFRIWGLGSLKSSFSKVLKGLFNHRAKKTEAKKNNDELLYKTSVEKITELVKMIRIFREEKKREDFWGRKKKAFREKRNKEQYDSKRDPRTGMEEPGTDS